jgi:hypothetical protein
MIVYTGSVRSSTWKRNLNSRNDISRDGIFHKNSEIHHFLPQKELRNRGIFKSRTSRQETKKIQIKLTTTRNKNEQQQEAKSDGEL